MTTLCRLQLSNGEMTHPSTINHARILERQIMIRTRPFQAFSTALALLLATGAWSPIHAQRHGDDYDDADPWSGARLDERGPDSAAVVVLIRGLAASDPVICQFAVASLGNTSGAQKAGGRITTSTGGRRPA